MKKTVLLIQYSANLDGSAFSALMLADGLRAAGWETHVAFAFEGPITDRFRAACHRVHVVPHKSWLRTRHLFRFAKYFVQERRNAHSFTNLFLEIEPNLIYINTAVSFAGALAAYRTRLPSVWHLRELFDDVEGEMRAPSVLRPLVRRTFRRYAGRLVANSESVARNMLGASFRNAAIVPNAVDARFFDEQRSPLEARRVFGLPEEGYVIGVPGTLRPMKGHPFFLDALANLIRRRSDVIAAIPGGGSPVYKEQLENLVEAKGLGRLVRFLGSLDDMPAFYRACDIACIPSVAEPFGRTVIEAFAVGTPVVASAVGGVRETVEDGRTGLLVPYGDVGRLAGSLERLLEDDALRGELQSNARLEAGRSYRAAVYKERLCTLVDELAGPTRLHSER
jgi:glycosyltransferase involved in cell wall biosynthesis